MNEIKFPIDFDIKRHIGWFICPNCKSKAIILDEEFNKQNMVDSLKDDFSRTVLKCSNCGRVDLLISFLENEEYIIDNI
jgi:predicted RNA-binding Zn-ribbon protein involved in translation (DUF1610 family)